MTTELSVICKNGLDFLGCRYPIMGGAMSWVSERNLVSAISNAGGFGVIACGAMSPEQLSAEIIATKILTKQNFGVNLITMHPALDELINVCSQNDVTHIVLAGGLPKGSKIESVKASGAKLLCFAPNLLIAKRLVTLGVDALIIEGSEAGGHIGSVSTSVLAQEILPEIKSVPIFVAGGIATGNAIGAYLEMGASGVQIGTRFVCATESIAHPNFKQAFIKAQARDAMPSVQIDPEFPVIPVRSLMNRAWYDFVVMQRDIIDKYRAEALSKAEAQLAIEHYWAGALRRAVIDGDIENGSLMAGQSVGLVKAIEPVAQIITQLIIETRKFLE